MNPSESKRLLAVLAHPDDESFGIGGTLAFYAHQGVRVDLFCATRGEAGDVDESFRQGGLTVAQVREKELHCAAETLGICQVILPGYRDSGMAGSVAHQHPQALIRQPTEQVALQVADWIRKLQPQVVITFDPSGGYMHPDHIAIHRATLRAVALAAGSFPDLAGRPFQVQKLYYHVMPKGLLKLAVWFEKRRGGDPRKIGKNHDIDLEAVAAVDYPVHAEIRYGRYLKYVEKACACHASQGGGRMTGGFVTHTLRRWLAVDRFMRVYPLAEGNVLERDLFTGVQSF